MKRRLPWTRMWPLILGLLLTLSCRSVPATHYYVLASSHSGENDTSSGGTDGVRLGVETFTVDPPYDQDRLVYRVGHESGEVGFYNHHRWAASPGRLVSTALIAGLRGTPGIAAVEPARKNGSYSMLLAGRVVALEEIDLPGRQMVRIQVDLKLFDMADKPADHKPVDHGTNIRGRFITATAEGRAEEVSDIMQLMQQAFAKLVVEVRAEIETAVNQ